MYNHNLKLDFIQGYSDKESMHRTCVMLFEVISKYEYEFEKDLCCMSVDELSTVMSHAIGLRESSKAPKISVIRKYLDWCVNTGIDGAHNVVDEVYIDSASKFATTTFSSPQDLNNFFDIIFDKDDENTVDNVYRCYLWMAFAGLRDTDAVKITTNEVDLKNLIIRHSGISYPIYTEAITAFRFCYESRVFVYKHPRYSSDILRQRCEGNILLRGIRSPYNVKSMRVELSRRVKKNIDNCATRKIPSYNSIEMSGSFYRLYMAELDGIEPDFKSLSIDRVLANGGQEASIERFKNRVISTMSDLEKDYNNWKHSFYK